MTVDLGGGIDATGSAEVAHSFAVGSGNLEGGSASGETSGISRAIPAGTPTPVTPERFEAGRGSTRLPYRRQRVLLEVKKGCGPSGWSDGPAEPRLTMVAKGQY